MRNVLIWSISLAMLVALYFGGVLQDRMRQNSGGLPFSPLHLWRALRTKELYLFVLLTILMIAMALGFTMLDELGYFATQAK